MDKNKLSKINKIIDELKVTEYNISKIETNTSFLALQKGNYKLANGKKINRESVIKKNGNSDAVAIFATTKDNEIILVIQPRVVLPTKTKIDIEIPAGYIEKEETIIDAAIRELKEETGYKTKELNIIDEYYPSLGYSSEKISIILATNCEKVGEPKPDADEFIKYITVTFEEFKYLLDNNYILDATARLAYYKTIEYIANKNQLIS
ncbi:MAG: NUDIX hydrolase [Bacilli bacterium]|nr:NUDIX hydrolase [Bacilli bacterium]